MDQAKPQPTQENQAQPVKEVEAKETFTPTCSRPECKCLHEHGLVAIKNADGSVSQYSHEQAKAMLESLSDVQKQLANETGGAK